MAGSEVTFERHFTVDQLAELWNMSDDFVRRLFLHEPGVVVFYHHRPGRRVYRTLRIPESVAQRVHTRPLPSFKEHAWKAKRASNLNWHQHIAWCIRFNDLRLQPAPRCDVVDLRIPQRSESRLTQFLHNPPRHLPLYAAVFVGTRRHLQLSADDARELPA